MGDPPLLELRNIVKSFPGVRALDGARFELRPGEVHALIGENGAGKSTLMNVAAGVLQPDHGQIFFQGRQVTLPNPHRAAELGIAVVFQELSLSPSLSVAENIFAGRQPTRWGLIDRRELYRQAQELLDRFRVGIDPRRTVRSLPLAHQQAVEILKALSQNPRVLILDEPTSSLTALEKQSLFENIRRLKRQGMGCAYISHQLAEVFEVADRVTVMRDGRYVGTFDAGEVSGEYLVQQMVGRELSNVYGLRRCPMGEEYFLIEGATRQPWFANVSFALRRGEILGLAGLVGAGRTELGRAIAGIEPLEAGSIVLEGQALSVRSPHQAIAQGIGYVTEDRKGQGLFLRMSLQHNCVAPRLGDFAGPLGWMRDRAIRSYAQRCRSLFNIVSTSIRQPVGRLSGGNQQKVLLSMWMGIEPRVLIVDEPTRGVDVGARSEIYSHLRELADRGVGIILISSDLQEILGLSDHVLVMRQGKIVGQFRKDQASEERIIAAAAGVELN